MTLEDAAKLLEWMREHGVHHARLGELELWIEPATPETFDGGESMPVPDSGPIDPLEDPATFGGEVPNFRVPEDEK